MQTVLLSETELDLDLDVYAEVEAIISDCFPVGMSSPTEAASSRGRAKVIIRDAANDDQPVDEAITA